MTVATPADAAVITGPAAELARRAEAQGHGPLPRNLVRLAADAQADRWTVHVEANTALLALVLVARVQLGTGSAEATIRCEWQANGKGGFRWSGATLYRDGAEEADGIAWRDVAPMVARGTGSMVHPEAEANGTTYQGRTAEQWRRVADAHAEAATQAYERGRDVRDRLAAKRGRSFGPLDGATLTDEQFAFRAKFVPAWVDAAEEATYAAFRRLDRRSTWAHTVSGVAHYEIAEAQDDRETPNARRFFQLSQRARVLARLCAADADAVEAGALEAEAEAECAPYVAAITAELEARESAWRAANPTRSVQAFAQCVIQTIGKADERFAEWWAENHRPGMTYYQGWDESHPGHASAAEVHASLRLRDDTNRALFAMGLEAAAHLRNTDDAEQLARAEKLAAAAERGTRLSAPGASGRRGEGRQVAVSVWSLMCGRVRGGFLSLDMAENIAAVEPWTGTRACLEAEDVRRLLLVRHGLDVRDRGRSAAREQLEAAQDHRTTVTPDS
jgi:hypothetical protein